jgi:4-amino-4-deoxy-L-arabinose transferase-like glycosyltransferase
VRKTASPARRALVLGSLAVLVTSLLLIATFPYGRDQGIYAVVARTVLEGGMPYRDAWDFKPPGIFLIYAAGRALFGSAQWGIRVLEIAGIAGVTLAMSRLTARWWDEPAIGLLAGALAALVHAQLDFWHSAQPESFGGMLSVLGVLAAESRRPRHRWWPLVLCGICFGCAGLLKPPLAGGGAVVALCFAWRARRRGAWQTLRPIGLVLLGGVLPFALCVAWFVARGAWPALRHTLFVFTPEYTALSWQGRNFAAMLLQAVVDFGSGYSLVLSLGVVFSLIAWRRQRHHAVPLLLGIVAMQLLGVALQGKYFPYHYGACWPLAALMAAYGWWQCAAWAVRRGRFAVGSVVSLALVALVARTATRDVEGHFWWRTMQRARLFLFEPLRGHDSSEGRDRLGSVADVSAAANRRVAEQIRRRVPAGTHVFVWGFEPVIYDLADRPSSSRFIYNAPQRAPWATGWARGELMKDLVAHPPQLIVVASGDPLPMVTGDGTDSADALDGFAELSSLLRGGYHKLMVVEDFHIFVHD